MKRLLIVGTLIFGTVVVWRLGDVLSADAVGMAIGVMLGILAGIPVSLLVLAGSRRREEREEERWQEASRQRAAALPYPQPPVIVLAGPAQAAQQAPYPAQPPGLPAPTWPQPAAHRQFKIVGEQEQWLE